MDPTAGVRGTSHPQLWYARVRGCALGSNGSTAQDGHQVLIFSQMTKVLNIIEDYLAFRNWKY
jgi:ATP-dependent DNA helicase